MFSVTHRGAMRGRYRISALTSGDASTTFFEDPQGLRTSVADYFAQTHNLILQYPRLPLIEVRGGRRTTHFPIEVCSILPHQRYLGRINEDETSALVKFATALPIEKKADIDRIHRVMGLDGNEYLDAFGASVDGEMMKVDARRLPAPNVLYQERGKAEGMHTKVNPGLQGWVWLFSIS
jgi:eukaryotic translation initiation factor 2C